MKESLRKAQDSQKAVQEASAQNARAIADGEDEALNAACANAVCTVTESLALLREVMLLFHENDRWGREPGAIRSLPLEELMRVGKLLRENRSLRQIVALAGRWTTTLKRKYPRRRVARVPHEAVGVTIGGELARLLPAELVQLRHPALRVATLARILEGRALATELKGPELLGRGPVIAVVDTSGSMGGARVILAQAVCLALALRCMEKRRPFYVLTFGGPGEIAEQDLRPSAEFNERLTRCLGLTFRGGTDFDHPLQRVCELCRQRPWSQADAVFITDGECSVTEATREVLANCRRRCDLQILGVLVAGGAGLRGVADAEFAIDPNAPEQLEADARGAKLLERIAGRL